ncbi:MAG: PAS domain-containing sensor histidine kinase [Longimicrobiales bacterium]
MARTPSLAVLAAAGVALWVLGRRDRLTGHLRRRSRQTAASLADARDREEQLRFLYEDNPSMYFTVAQDGTVLSANRFGANYLGYTPAELKGRSVLDVVHEDDHEEVRRHLEECARSPGEVFQWEFRKVKKSGETLWVREIARAVRGADGELAVLIVCHDVTEAKRADDQRVRLMQKEREARAAEISRIEAERRRAAVERVMASRERLIRGFSHDVKNPLGAADGYLQVLEEGVLGELEPRQAQSVRQCRRSIRSALDLIEVLVDIARAEAGRLEIEDRPVDVGEISSSVAAEYRAQAHAASLDLQVRVASSVPVIRSDPGRVRQILGNLISNAVKYTDQGAVTVRVETREDGDGATPGPGRWIAVAVCDTGPGIPPEKRELLFQEYGRIEPDRKGSTGLGLAISRRLAELLGGAIGVSSEVGAGSTFTLWLPCT